MSAGRKQRKAAEAVKDLVNAIQKDESDFEDCYESSGDDFRLRKSDIKCSYSSESPDNETADDPKIRVLRMKTGANNQNTEGSSSDSEAEVLQERSTKRKRAKQTKAKQKYKGNDESSSDSEANIPLARLTKRKKTKQKRPTENDENKEN